MFKIIFYLYATSNPQYPMPQFLFRPIDIASLCFFRFIFGLLALIEIISVYIYQRWWLKAWAPDQFRFKYYGFEWVEPLPEPLLSLVFLATAAGAVGVMLGWYYRWAAVVWALGFIYSFMLEKAFYLNHGYLFSVLSILLIFMPAHRNYSVDTWQRRVPRVKTIPYWPVFLLCFLMGVVYFFGGIAKLNVDWLNGQPLKVWLKSKSDYFLIGPLLAKEWTAYFMSYGGLLLDLTVTFFLIFRRTRMVAFIFVVLFHLMNMMVFQIGIFPWLSTTITAMYFTADFPRRIFRWLRSRIKRLQPLFDRWNKAWAKIPEVEFHQSKVSNNSIRVGIVMICLVQLLIPLRHHLYEGDPAWTENGHRGSWRMMLRGKTGRGTFIVAEENSDRKEIVKPKDYLYQRQEQKLYGQPDMILEFAHFLKKEYEAKGWKNPKVYADIHVRLNGRKYARFVKEDFDLGTWEWKWMESPEWLETEKR
jgi:vitamin K-dependent gamma-carboxylase